MHSYIWRKVYPFCLVSGRCVCGGVFGVLGASSVSVPPVSHLSGLGFLVSSCAQGLVLGWAGPLVLSACLGSLLG